MCSREFFFLRGKDELILKQGPLHKGPETNKNYKEALQDPDVDGEEQAVPPARRRYSFPDDLDQKEPSCGREVDDPQLHGTSTLHHRLHRLESTHLHLLYFQLPRSAARRIPVEGRRAHQLQGASSPHEVADQQRNSTERHHQRGNLPPPNATPTASPPPQRRRGKYHSNLHYVQARSGVSPPSRCRSGRRRGGEPTNLRRRGGTNGVA